MAEKNLLILGLLATLAASAQPQTANTRQRKQIDPRAPVDNPTTPDKVSLGRFLFESPLLSRNRKISCATCHDPNEAFADGLAESRGIFHTQVGRNSPTLCGIAAHPGFVGPLPPLPPAPRRGRPPKAKPAPLLSLEDRCLTPIENPIEMGNTLKKVVRTLRAVDGLRQRFDGAFGKRGVGINSDRIGKAMAAYLRAAAPVPQSKYRDFLEGDVEALSDAELRGLQLFRKRGKCASCHSGSYLSDGRLHQVTSIDGFRPMRQFRTARDRFNELTRRIADEERKDRGRFPRGNPLQPERAEQGKSIVDVTRVAPNQPPPNVYYGGPQIQARGTQTPTLWNVTQTAPYFRDGSVEDLEICIRQHIAELQVAGHRTNIVRTGAAIVVEDPLKNRLPERLRPTYRSVRDTPKPAILNDDEIRDLMAFLRTLAPTR